MDANDLEEKIKQDLNDKKIPLVRKINFLNFDWLVNCMYRWNNSSWKI